MPNWGWALIGSLAFYLVGLLAAPQLPDGGGVLQTVCYVAAVILLVIGVILLIMWFSHRGRSRI